MSAGVLIHIDRLFYLPYFILRYILTYFNSRKASPEGPVIIIKFMGMGSITRFVSLCDTFQIDRKKIILVTFDKQREICELLGLTSAWYIRTSNFFAFLLDCIQVILRSWRTNPSFIIDYERCSYSVGTFRFLMAWGTKAEVVCFENRARDYLQGRLKAFSMNRINMETMFRIGMQNMVPAKTTSTEQVVEIQNNTLLVNCNASNYLLARRYPIASFVSLIEMLHDYDPQLQFCFTGSGREFEYVEKIVKPLCVKKIPARNMAGQWGVEQLCNALAECRVFITCDSGPLHLSALLGVPTVAIWGPTQDGQFGYDSLSHIKNCSLRMSCSPCLIHPYSPIAKACNGAYTCINSLPVQIVFNETVELLSEKATTRSVRLLPGMKVASDALTKQYPN